MNEGGLREERAGFIRQRRNLILISVITTIYLLGDVQVGKEAQIFGALVTIHDPSVLSYGLAAAWVWLVIRYWQYLMVIPSTYQSYLESATNQLVKWTALKLCKNNEGLIERGKRLHRCTASAVDISSRNPLVWEVTMKLDVSYKASDGKISNKSFPEFYQAVREDKLRFAQNMAVLHVLVNTPFATEYVLPPVIAFIPAIIFVTTWFIA